MKKLLENLKNILKDKKSSEVLDGLIRFAADEHDFFGDIKETPKEYHDQNKERKEQFQLHLQNAQYSSDDFEWEEAADFAIKYPMYIDDIYYALLLNHNLNNQEIFNQIYQYAKETNNEELMEAAEENPNIHEDFFSTKEFAEDGKIEYRNKEGQLHRLNGPAVIFPDGSEYWYLNGELHREDGPAVIDPDGTKKWYLNGKLHREDGPAAIWPDGGKEWWVNGELHREDGPAIINSAGSEAWYINGKRHREDGPAAIYSDGTKEWYINDKPLTEEEFNKLYNPE